MASEKKGTSSQTSGAEQRAPRVYLQDVGHCDNELSGRQENRWETAENFGWMQRARPLVPGLRVPRRSSFSMLETCYAASAGFGLVESIIGWRASRKIAAMACYCLSDATEVNRSTTCPWSIREIRYRCNV
jgi:hypothetical protein